MWHYGLNELKNVPRQSQPGLELVSATKRKYLRKLRGTASVQCARVEFYYPLCVESELYTKIHCTGHKRSS